MTGREEELKKDYERWSRLFCQGGQDPFWTDGNNLQIVRNHITAGPFLRRYRPGIWQGEKTSGIMDLNAINSMWQMKTINICVR